MVVVCCVEGVVIFVFYVFVCSGFRFLKFKGMLVLVVKFFGWVGFMGFISVVLENE